MPQSDVRTVAVNPESCAVCMRCALACSYTYEKRFEVGLARIRVVEVERDVVEIEFADNCNKCWKCVENCLYGALTLVGEG